MSSTSETGHYKNVANFGRLLQACQSMQAYQPTRTALQLPQLTALYLQATQAMAALDAASAALSHSSGTRRAGFEGLQPLATRVYNALISANEQAAVLPSIKEHLNKLRGRRSTASPKPSADSTTPQPAIISVSQLSFDAQVQHFTAMLAGVQQEGSNAPNEPDLTIAALQQVATHLQELNNDVIAKETTYNMAVMRKQEVLYAPSVGLVPIALAVKAYVKGAFGTKGIETKLVAVIHFKKLA